LVKNVVNSNLQQGRQLLSWNGQNDSGNDLANGLYLVYLRVGDKISSKKILLNK
jgi:flagellar hook assembly protein FlgD